MSAAFSVGGDVFWGTNGAVEAYVAALAAQSAAQLGLGHPLAVYFREEHEGFYNGKVLFLDLWLADATGRAQFLRLLDAATRQLVQDGAFTAYGQAWVATVVAGMRARIAGESGHAALDAAADGGR